MLYRRTTLHPDGIPDELIKAEIAKCGEDPIYFITKYCKIVHPMLGSIPFELYPKQEAAINDYLTGLNILQLGDRQTGKTSLVAAYALWYAMIRPYKAVMFTSCNLASVYNARYTIKHMLDNLPSWLRPRLHVDNKQELVFENMSSILFKTPMSHHVRGLSISLLICDEFAYVDDQQQSDFLNCVCPTLSSTNSQMIITTTPNPRSKHFPKLIQDVINISNKQSARYKYINNITWDKIPTLTDHLDYNKFKELFNGSF